MIFNNGMRNTTNGIEKNRIGYNTTSFIDSGKEIDPGMEALRIALIYGCLGVLWVFLSNSIFSMLFKDPVVYKQALMYKGGFYIFATGMMVYILIYNRMKLLKNAVSQISEGYEELSGVHEELVSLDEELRQQFEELEKHRNALLISDQRYELLIEGANDGIWDWDLKNNSHFFSIKWKGNLGYEYGEIKDTLKDWKELLHPEDRERVQKDVREYLKNRSELYKTTYRLRCKDGSYRWILSRGKGIWDANGRAIRMAGSHTDITELKLMEEKLHSLAYYDTLTGLPNRHSFETEMEKLLQEKNCKKDKLALIYMDIDNFKHINDTLGHLAGDLLLQYVAYILADFDDVFRIITKISGDEFILVLDSVDGKADVVEKIELLLPRFKKPWRYQNHEFFISFSMGIALYPDHGEDLTTLLKNADVAMFSIKDNGKNNYCFYEDVMREKTLNYMNMINQLHHAIENEEFTLLYQPQINLKTGEIIGVEALIRWNHPIRGVVSPIEFIPLAEETGHIHEIDKWVLKAACRQNKKWRELGYKDFKIAINVSSKSLKDGSLAKEIDEILDPRCKAYCNIQLEITETAVMADLNTAIVALEQIKELGLTIALDDFGTGYSSLTYLKSLPIDILKMDRVFINSITNKDKEEVIVRTVIELAHALNLEVVAEGIETPEQLAFLKKYDCDIGQGYLISEPIPADKINKLLETNYKFKI